MSATTTPRSGNRSIIAWNSSTTITRRGEFDVGASSDDVADALGRQHRLPVAQFRTQAQHRALRLGLVEVGHDARDVGQAADRLERRTALEVDEEERDAVGRMGRASAVSQARRNSLLPLPVVPATIACGPRATRSSSSCRRCADTDRGAEGASGARRGQRLRERLERARGRAVRRPRRRPRASGGEPYPGRPGRGFRRAHQLGHDRAAHGAVAPSLHDRARRRLDHDDRLEPGRQLVDRLRDSAIVAASRIGSPGEPAVDAAFDVDEPEHACRHRRCGSAVAHDHAAPEGTLISTRPGRQRCATCTSRARATACASEGRPTMPIPRSTGASTGASSSRAARSSTSRSSSVGRRAVDPQDAPSSRPARAPDARGRRRASRIAPIRPRGCAVPTPHDARPQPARDRAGSRSPRAGR